MFIVQTQFPEAFWPNSMSMSWVIGGAGSGVMGNQGIVAVRGSYKVVNWSGRGDELKGAYVGTLTRD